MSGEFAVRASIAQSQLEEFRGLPQADELLGHIPTATQQEIDRASRIAWLDGEINCMMSDAVAEVLGLEAGCAYYRRSYARAYERPLFRNFTRGAMRLLGGDPGSYLKLVPIGTGTVFRGFGEYRVGLRDEQSLRLDHIEIPSRCFTNEGAWIIFSAYSMLAAGDFADRPMTVETEFDTEKRRAHHHFRWE